MEESSAKRSYSSTDTVVSDAAKRRAVESTEKTKTDTQLCQECSEVPIGGDYATFVLACPHEHAVCAVCFSRMEHARGCNCLYHCGLCKEDFDTYEVVYTRFQEMQHTYRKSKERFVPGTITPDPNKDPIRNHEEMSRLDGDVGDSFVGLTLSTSVGGKIEGVSSFFALNGDTDSMGEAQIHLLERIFQILHVLVITNDKNQTGARNFHPPMDDTKTEYSLRVLAAQDYSVLRRLVHVLAYGAPLRDCPVDPDAKRWSNLFVSTFAITDMVQHLRSPFPGLIKSTVGFQSL